MKNNTNLQASGKSFNRKRIIRKLRLWRDRLAHEFLNLLVQQRHFHELKAITQPYIGTETGWELVRSMVRGYAAYAYTAIRRIAEEAKPNAKKGKEIVSLPTFLCEVQNHAHLVTRSLQRRRYKKAMKHLPERIYLGAADRTHDAVCDGYDVLQPDSVKGHLDLIRRTAKRIGKLTDKVYAHIERDRRRIPKNLGLDELDSAISALFKVLRMYSLCLFGEEVVLPFIEQFSVASDLRKIWPGDVPLPKTPGVNDAEEI